MMLQIEHLKIAFPNPKGHFEAVKDFSLNVEEGQVIGIVGESGSGKSMTAHCHYGLAGPEERPGLRLHPL